MTELRENCTWRRCSVSRARFRLKLYEPAVKCLGDVGPVEILCASTSARLKYFYPDAKGVLSRLFSLIRHSSRSVYIYASILRHLTCSSLFPRKLSPYYFLASAVSAAINRGRHLRWNQEICNVWRVAVLTDFYRRARYFYSRILDLSGIRGE